jgi:hypothetical protein
MVYSIGMKYQCPKCSVDLTEIVGNQMNREGITLRCENISCMPQVVEAWGKNVKEAYEVVLHRFAKKKE